MTQLHEAIRRAGPGAIAAFTNLPTNSNAVDLWGEHCGTKQGRLSNVGGPSPVGPVDQRLPVLAVGLSTGDMVGTEPRKWQNVLIVAERPPQDYLSDHAGITEGRGRLQNNFAFNDKDKMQVTTAELSRRNAAQNMAVYEQLVADKFVEEEIVCSLYLQRVQRRSELQKQRHREVAARNKEWCESIDTPYNRRKHREMREKWMLEEAQRMATPRFRDLDEVYMPRIQRELMRARNPELFPPPPPPAGSTKEVAEDLAASFQSAPLPPTAEMPSRAPASPRVLLENARHKLEALGKTSLHNPPGFPLGTHIPVQVSHVIHRDRILKEAGLTPHATRAVPQPKEEELPITYQPPQSLSASFARSSTSSSPRRLGSGSMADTMFSMKWAQESRPLVGGLSVSEPPSRRPHTSRF